MCKVITTVEDSENLNSYTALPGLVVKIDFPVTVKVIVCRKSSNLASTSTANITGKEKYKVTVHIQNNQWQVK